MKRFAILLVISTSLLACEKKEAVVSAIITPTLGEVSSKVLLQGRIQAEKSSLVRAPMEAQLVKLFKSVGDLVEAGSPIASIAQQRDETKVTDLLQAKGKVQQIQLEIERLKVKLENAKKEHESLRKLVKSGSVSKGEVENAKVARELLVKELSAHQAEMKVAQGTVEAKDRSRKDMVRTLASNSKGIVTQLWMNEESITPGLTIPKDTIVAVIEEHGQFQFKGQVVEADYLKLKIGMNASVQLVHSPEKFWAGSVKSLSQVPRTDQFGIGRFDVVVSLTGNQDFLKSGLEAKSEIPLSKGERVIRVPRTAVKHESGRYWVTLPGENGPKLQEVTIGAVGDQHIEIRSGLKLNTQLYQAYAR